MSAQSLPVRAPERRRARSPFRSRDRANGTGIFVEGLDDGEAAAPAEAAVPERTERRSIAVAIGIGLSLLGVLLLLFGAYLFGYTNLQAARSQRRLVALYTSSGETPAFAGHTPADGVPVGIIRIPSLAVNQVVVQGTSSADLQNGPGLMPNGAVPGSRGNAVIAGRHATYGAAFRSISTLRAGDTITVVDYLGKFTYKVTGVVQLGAGHSVSIRPTIQPLLTLLTSASSVPPSGLVAVTAKLEGKPLPTAIASPPTTTSELSLGGSWSWEILLWLAALVAALALTVVAYRRVRRPALVYLVSMPVVLVLVLFTFENAARMLPATM